jgi:hypothetical protein
VSLTVMARPYQWMPVDSGNSLWTQIRTRSPCLNHPEATEESKIFSDLGLTGGSSTSIIGRVVARCS